MRAGLGIGGIWTTALGDVYNNDKHESISKTQHGRNLKRSRDDGARLKFSG